MDRKVVFSPSRFPESYNPTQKKTTEKYLQVLVELKVKIRKVKWKKKKVNQKY